MIDKISDDDSEPSMESYDSKSSGTLNSKADDWTKSKRHLGNIQMKQADFAKPKPGSNKTLNETVIEKTATLRKSKTKKYTTLKKEPADKSSSA